MKDGLTFAENIQKMLNVKKTLVYNVGTQTAFNHTGPPSMDKQIIITNLRILDKSACFFFYLGKNESRL